MRTGIALGCNVGTGLLFQMKQARDMLLPFHNGDRASFRQSCLYRTLPQDCPEGSPDFYNAAIEPEWKGEDGFELLGLLGDIEYFFGREYGGVRNSPRPMDLDILYFGDTVMDSPALTIPHPRLARREFVLKPLEDILGDEAVPGLGKSPRELVSGLAPSGVTLVTREW